MNQPTKESLRLQNEELKRMLDESLAASGQMKRNLEIEASLERVRTVVMSMQKPDELSGISEIVFTELKGLGFYPSPEYRDIH